MAPPLPPGYPPGSTMEVISQLEGMGFSRELAEQAVASTEGSQSSPSLQAALDWLLQLCQTPRQDPAAARAPGSEEELQEELRLGQPSPRSSEEEELSRAIQMSLTVQSPAAMPGHAVPPGTLPPGMLPLDTAVARQPSEEEELEAAIAASLSDLRQDTARAIEQVESYQTAEAQRHSMLQYVTQGSNPRRADRVPGGTPATTR